ncbi:hypothetical protein P8452_15107 [Trifolium repens]|nr:hypothetical protein P8452_15107 [Trifolium repens]
MNNCRAASISFLRFLQRRDSSSLTATHCDSFSFNNTRLSRSKPNSRGEESQRFIQELREESLLNSRSFHYYLEPLPKQPWLSSFTLPRKTRMLTRL